MRLLAALQIAGAEMNIEDVNQFSRRDFQITANTAALFPAGRRKVIRFHISDGKAADQHISVSSTAQLAGFSNVISIAHGLGKVLGLILLFAASSETDHFLQRDYVGIQFAQDLRNPEWANTSIHAPAFVGVISGDPEKWQFF